MRLRICSFLISLFVSNYTSATNYYVSAKGNDNNTGKSSTSPWQTIERINHTRFIPGDSILFRRGDAWREGQALYILQDGSADEHIVYAAYGKGAKPLILNSRDISSPAWWIKVSGNIWKTRSKVNITGRDIIANGWQYRQVTPDVANLIFNNENAVGFKKRYLPDLKIPGDFCLNTADTLLYLCADKNPGNYYNRIEATGIRNAEDNIEGNGRSHISFVDLDIRYSKNNGLFLTNCRDIKIVNCDFSFIGGCYFPIDTYMNSYNPNPARMGNGIQLWQGNADITISGCKIIQVYDAGISPQGTSIPYTLKNIRIHHNIIDKCFYSFEFWGHQQGSICDGVFFENNTCLNSGFGWSTAQRPDKDRCAHLQFSSSKMSFKNVFIRNNIFDNSACFCSYANGDYDGSNTDVMWEAFTIDYNCYYQPDEKEVVRWKGGKNTTGGGDYFMKDVKAYQQQTGKDIHSIFVDPLVKKNYSLGENSPAVNAGIDIGYKFNGNTPDLGAIEFLHGERKIKK